MIVAYVLGSSILGLTEANLINSVFLNGYRSFLNKNDNLDSAINEMDNFMNLLSAMGIENAEIDVSIMRGHSYYTGIVFEFFSIDFPDLPAIGGGGRYEDLVSKFSKTKIVGVGASIGVSRLLVALMESKQIDLSKFETPIDVAVLIMGDNNTKYASGIVTKLQAENIPTVAYLDTDKKFKNQIEYANKIKAKFSVIIGDDEVKNQQISIKNMSTGEQQTLPVADAIKLIKAA